MQNIIKFTLYAIFILILGAIPFQDTKASKGDDVRPKLVGLKKFPSFIPLKQTTLESHMATAYSHFPKDINNKKMKKVTLKYVDSLKRKLKKQGLDRNIALFKRLDLNSDENVTRNEILEHLSISTEAFDCIVQKQSLYGNKKGFSESFNCVGLTVFPRLLLAGERSRRR